jgi:hypothetical protein
MYCIRAIIAITFLVTVGLQAEDKIYNRKITDTKKDLDRRKSKPLERDTKKHLRKTDTLSNVHKEKLVAEAVKALGKNVYEAAKSNAPELLRQRLDASWMKMQNKSKRAELKSREKRDTKRSRGKLSKTRARDYAKKYSALTESDAGYDDKIAKLDAAIKDFNKKK